MDEFEDCILLRTNYESCYRRGNLEINFYEDPKGNIIIHTINQDGEEWLD